MGKTNEEKLYEDFSRRYDQTYAFISRLHRRLVLKDKIRRIITKPFQKKNKKNQKNDFVVLNQLGPFEDIFQNIKWRI